MPRNGSGTMQGLNNSWSPPINGQLAAAGDWQAIYLDLISALTQSLSRDGQGPMTGNLQMGGNAITGLSDATGTGQALTFAQLFNQGTEADLASAATTDIGAQLTNFLRITGTTTITSFGTNYKGPRFLRFSGAVLLTNSATLALPGGANITTAAGDCLIAIPTATLGTADGWKVVAYQNAGFTVGKGAGSVASNTVVGSTALASNSTGAQVVALGYGALNANTASDNTAVGYLAAGLNTSGTQNTVIGRTALYSNTTGSKNISVGEDALRSNTTASNNTAVGYQAGYSNTTSNANTFLGQNSGYSTTGAQNTFAGASSGYSTTGSGNTFIGYTAGYNVSTGSKNTIIGQYNGNQGGLDIRTGSNYIVLSDGDGNPRMYYEGVNNLWAIKGNQSNGGGAVIYNDNATNPSCLLLSLSAAAPNNSTNYFVYCYDSTNTLRAKIQTNGGLANYSANNSNLSDRREKMNFAPAGDYLAKICAIPVQTYNYIDQDMENDGGLTLGVVAQDVQAVAPELVTESNWANEGEEPKMRLSIYQTDMQYALMKALQELKAEFDAYKATHP